MSKARTRTGWGLYVVPPDVEVVGNASLCEEWSSWKRNLMVESETVSLLCYAPGKAGTYDSV